MRTLTQQIVLVLALLLLILTAVQARAGTVELRVGNDTGCDHSTIQGAMDSTLPGDSVSLLVNHGDYDENVNIANRTVDITGGYSSCSSSDPVYDLEFHERGICHYDTICAVDHIYDLGAYEFPVIIFSDRFEQ